ncbi:MAG TPA: ABC transporter ATP-binding protein [Terriglobales bacterium]|nr:ABC transporter ATP-binding protein [Terriglobales bacterium]
MAPTVEVRGLSKKYVLGRSRQRYESIRELIARGVRKPIDVIMGRRGRKETEFWALRDVSFDVTQGEVLGVIGRNGAGKSTLLKIMSRITDPTEGSVVVRGRLSSLLEVGTGFHPELTGRENIYLNGAILGMTKSEISAKFDEIVAFSEVEKFLDTPVKRYSSGMFVRLAFSVAAHLDPEILVVDEVLAVGDMGFQKKCLGKMSEVSQGGRTVLFVSHNMAAVQNLCANAIVLSEGKLVFRGTAKDAIDFYMRGVRGEGSQGHILDISKVARLAGFQAALQRIEFYTTGNTPVCGILPMGQSLQVRVHFVLDKPRDNVEVGLGFDNMFGQRIFTAHTSFEPARSYQQQVGSQTYVCSIPSLTLVPGEYTLRVWVDGSEQSIDLVDDAARIQIIPSDYYGTGRVPWNGAFVLEHHWYLEQGIPAR